MAFGFLDHEQFTTRGEAGHLGRKRLFLLLTKFRARREGKKVEDTTRGPAQDRVLDMQRAKPKVPSSHCPRQARLQLLICGLAAPFSQTTAAARQQSNTESV